MFNNDNEDIWLPPELSKKKLISDYLNEIQKVIKFVKQNFVELYHYYYDHIYNVLFYLGYSFYFTRKLDWN